MNFLCELRQLRGAVRWAEAINRHWYGERQLKLITQKLLYERNKLRRWIDDGHRDWAVERVRKTGMSIAELEGLLRGVIQRRLEMRRNPELAKRDFAARSESIVAMRKNRDSKQLDHGRAVGTAKFGRS